MPIGFIFLTINEESKRTIYQQVTKVPNVAEIYNLYGEYDMIIQINAETTEKLGHIIHESIQPLEGITKVKTIIGC
jgi:DNA-binding Lrp family transcriptional regulator